MTWDKSIARIKLLRKVGIAMALIGVAGFFLHSDTPYVNSIAIFFYASTGPAVVLWASSESLLSKLNKNLPVKRSDQLAIAGLMPALAVVSGYIVAGVNVSIARLDCGDSCVGLSAFSTTKFTLVANVVVWILIAILYSEACWSLKSK